MDRTDPPLMTNMDRAIAQRTRRWRRPATLAGIGIAVLGVAAASGLRPFPAPTLDRHTVVLDTVSRGPLERVISGPGKLVPAHERVIAAHERALVETVYLEPGARVLVGAPIIKLSNPEAERELLEAQRELTAALAEHVNLRADLQKQLLDIDARIHQLSFEKLNADRRAEAFGNLAARGWVADLDLKQSHDLVVDLRGRIDIEHRKKAFLDESRIAKLEAQTAKIDQLKSFSQFQQERNARMRVTAPIEGILQEIAIEEGQWVDAGQTLARVIEPTKLKAVLNIPQTYADEVALGLEASIDTRIGVARGYVGRVDPAVQDGSVVVEVNLTDSLPKGARSQLSVFGTIRVARIDDTLSLLRPAGSLPHTMGTLFSIDHGQSTARLRSVVFGETSGDRIELLEGGRLGEEFIVSDMSPWKLYESVNLGD